MAEGRLLPAVAGANEVLIMARNKISPFWLFFLVYCVPGLAWSGETRLLHVELSYSGSAVSYILYKNGVQVCVSNDTVATQMDCNVEIDATPMTFVLTAVDANGEESPQSAPYILVPPTPDPVVPGNYIPQVNFTTSATSGVAPLLVTFDARSSSDFGGQIVSYDWSFGDGGAGTGNFFDYTFVAPGTYTVTLTIMDDNNASAEKTATITVTAPAPAPAPAPAANTPPVAVITATPIQAGTSRIRFDAATSSDTDGTIATYAWNFGDGDTASGQQFDHEYLTAGNYTVVLTVTDNKGASSQDQMILTVVDPPKPPNVLPLAVISASSQQRLMHFVWEYTGTDPGLAGFRLYQNSRLVCEIANPAARQADCQTYVDNGAVRLWVTSYDQAGVESTASGPLAFDSTGLFAAAGGDAPLAVHFTSGSSSDPDGTITSYAWDFGDGSTADGMAADHSFTVPADYTVTLTVTDNSGGQVQATTIIRVTDAHPPAATSASFNTVQDKSVTATLSASDTDGSQLQFRITQDGTLGSATITDAAKGVFTYVPNPGVSGTDTFIFKVNDGTFDSNPAVVSIVVQKKNTAPTAADKTLTVLEDGTASDTMTATDADNDPLSYSLVSLPAHGAVSVVNAGMGAFTYTPAPNYHGADSFTFKVNDGSLDSALATVAITIAPGNDAPVAAPVSLPATEDLAASGQLLGSDSDGNALTYTIVSNGNKGKAIITDANSGAFTYTPLVNKNGQDSFVYRVSDGALSAEATVSVLIAPVNDAPTARGFNLAAKEDVKALGKLVGADPDGDQLTYSIVKDGSKGKAVITSVRTGAFTYTPNVNKNGDDSFVYRVSDGTLAIDVMVKVMIAAVNDAPTAAAVNLSAKPTSKALGKLSGADLDGDSLVYSIVSNGSKGKALIVNAKTGSFTYTPAANANGTDSFVYRVSDGTLTADSTVTVTFTIPQ